MAAGRHRLSRLHGLGQAIQLHLKTSSSKKLITQNSIMNKNEIGVKLIAHGVDSYFRPWYFDGKIVFWGPVEQTRSKGIEQAQAIRNFHLKN